MERAIKLSLKAVRVNAKYTLKAAAGALGVSRATLHRYENGATTPRWSTLQSMEKLYHFPAELMVVTDAKQEGEE